MLAIQAYIATILLIDRGDV